MPSFREPALHVCPVDGQNLNRVLPGKAIGTASEPLDHWLSQNVIRQTVYDVVLVLLENGDPSGDSDR